MSWGWSAALLFTNADHKDGWIGEWSPGIGDPNFVGWLTVVLYLCASLLCFRASTRVSALPFRSATAGETGASSHSPRFTTSVFVSIAFALFGARRRLLSLPAALRLRALWLSLAVVLLLLGINKQLDLQTALTEVGRMLARAQGWYENRRRVQAVFIASVALGGLAAVRAVFLLAQGDLRHVRSVLAGTVFLVCFVIVRAASFHHIDEFLGFDVGGLRMNWVIEVGGLSFIILGTFRYLRAMRPSAVGATPRP